MWVFAYGSLMSDGWESNFGCQLRTLANLKGYSRVLNKASIRNWGTKAAPCMTLNLMEVSGADCWGVGFRFEESSREDVVSYLKQREGTGFRFFESPIVFASGEVDIALSSIYEGKGIVPEANIRDLLTKSRETGGSSGLCGEYLEGVRRTLATEGIVDPEIERVWYLVDFGSIS